MYGAGRCSGTGTLEADGRIAMKSNYVISVGTDSGDLWPFPLYLQQATIIQVD
jgi:hypothetical protein